MPAKRKAASARKETVKEPVARRSTRGTSTVGDGTATGTKRKASPSPTPAPKKAASAKRGRTRSPSPAPNNRQSRGRATREQRKPEVKEPSRSASNQKGRVTRNVVQEVEEKKSTEKTRSSSRGAKTPVLPVTPKQKTETPKPRAAVSRGRSATPKQNKTTPKQVTVTPKQKSATPKQKPTPKQKQQAPKKQKSPPTTKKATPKSTPKKKTKPDPPPRSSRSRRSKEVEEPDEESEENAAVNGKEQTEEESPVPNVTTEGEDMEVATENAEKEDSMDADKDAEVEDEASNEEKDNDNNEEQEDKAETLHVISKTEEADKLEDMSEETETKKQTEEAEEEPAVTEDADEEQKVEGDGDDIQDPTEECGDVSEKAEDTKQVENVVEEDEPEVEQNDEVENNVADSSEKKDNDMKDEEPAEDESEKGDESVTVVEEAIEIDDDEESEQVDLDEKEGECAEVEESNANEIEESEVEITKPAEDSSVPEQSHAKVVEKNDVGTKETSIELDDNDSNDGVEVISDSSEKPEQDVIDLNDDSGDDVITVEEPAVNDLTSVDDVGKGSGDQEQLKSVVSVEEISDDDIEEINTEQNNVQGNGTGDDKNEDIEVIEFVEQVDKYVENLPTKRKFGDVENEEIDDNSPVKKVRMSTEEEIQENGAGSQEDVADDFVVIEMSDVPQATSTEVKSSLPNPIFNRSFIPNPTFSGSSDSSKQFSVVTYNVLADCHLFRNDYSFTEAKYLEPDYRLKKIIEEIRYLDGDVVCMQEVDPQFYQQQLLPSMKTAGYEGLHKQRAGDYYNEGEATFYKNSRFELVNSESSTLQHLLKKELVDGIEPTIKDAVEKYMSLPDVIIVTKLKCKNTGQEVTVGNVHIQWGEMKVPDAQCVQIASAVKEIVSMATGDNFPHIICGDFNSPPLSPGYLVAKDGYPSGDDTINTLMKIEGLQLPDGKKASLVNSLWPAFQHTSSSLRSVYSEAQGYEPEVSSYNCVMCHCVDYIFYSSTSLENVGVLQTASKEKVMETGGIPNCYFPSDHISLKSVLSFK